MTILELLGMKELEEESQKKCLLEWRGERYNLLCQKKQSFLQILVIIVRLVMLIQLSNREENI